MGKALRYMLNFFSQSEVWRWD